MDYADRLRFFKLNSLEDRRIRGGLIRVFKIVKSFEEVQFVRGLNFSLNRQRLRGNSFQLKRDLVKSFTPRYNFTPLSPSSSPKHTNFEPYPFPYRTRLYPYLTISHSTRPYLDLGKVKYGYGRVRFGSRSDACSEKEVPIE